MLTLGWPAQSEKHQIMGLSPGPVCTGSSTAVLAEGVARVPRTKIIYLQECAFIT